METKSDGPVICIKQKREEMNTTFLSESPNSIRVIKSRRLKRQRHVARMGRGNAPVGFRWEKPDGRKPLGRHRRSWKNKINTDLREVVQRGKVWIDLAQDRDRWR